MRGGDPETAKRLKLARERKGYLTATAAAEAMGVRVQTYLAHENGSNGFRKSASRYARAFGVHVEWLALNRGPMTGSKPKVLEVFEELDEAKQAEAMAYMEFLKTRP